MVVNLALVLRNWLIGSYLVEFEQHGADRAEYGVKLLSRLANDLKARDLRGLSVQMLERTRQFYSVYPQLGSRISSPLVRKSRVLLLRGESMTKSSPVVRKSSRGFDHLQHFLLELGTGFCFEARQKRITLGNEHDYLDLVFYQRRLRCHVLLDLKVRPFQHGDAGQMNFYLNWWKRHALEPGDNPPVGIILCSDRDRTKVEFATAGIDNKLFVSRYLVNLPSAEQLSRFVEADRARIESALQRKQPKTKHAEHKSAAGKRRSAL